MADLSGFNKKFDGLLQVAKAVRALPLDAVAFANYKLANELLNLPENAVHPQSAAQGAGIIRRISGMLVRSITLVRTGESSAKLIMNSSVAPYAEKVDNYSRNRYGKGYIELFVSFYRELIERTMKDSLNDAIHSVRDGKEFVYKNPFGQLRSTAF